MENQWELEYRTKNVRSISIKLRGFRSQEKTTRTILMILGSRKTRDHACSPESKIVQIVRLSKKPDVIEKSRKKRNVLARYLDIRYFYHNGDHIGYPNYVRQVYRMPRGRGHFLVGLQSVWELRKATDMQQTRQAKLGYPI